MPLGLEHIQAFSPLFAHCRLDFKNPLGVAAYYVLLIDNFPTNFRAINKKAKQLMKGQYKESQIYNGRLELLQRGFIAKVLPVHSEDIDLDREEYLPISPELAWKDNVKNLDGIYTPDGISFRTNIAGDVENVFKEKLGKYGTKIENESITLFHSSRWLLYTLVYNMKRNKNLRMLLGGLGSFQDPHIKYYEDMLKEGLKTKIICFRENEEVDDKIKNILNLKRKYLDNIEIKANPVSHGTSRRIIYDNMAIDGKKLYSFGNSDLSYISTIYCQTEYVERMRVTYEKLWLNSLPIALE